MQLNVHFIIIIISIYDGREVGSIFDVRYSVLNIEYRTRKETAVSPILDEKPGFRVYSNYMSI